LLIHIIYYYTTTLLLLTIPIISDLDNNVNIEFINTSRVARLYQVCNIEALLDLESRVESQSLYDDCVLVEPRDLPSRVINPEASKSDNTTQIFQNYSVQKDEYSLMQNEINEDVICLGSFPLSQDTAATHTSTICDILNENIQSPVYRNPDLTVNTHNQRQNIFFNHDDTPIVIQQDKSSQKKTEQERNVEIFSEVNAEYIGNGLQQMHNMRIQIRNDWYKPSSHEKIMPATMQSGITYFKRDMNNVANYPDEIQRSSLECASVIDNQYQPMVYPAPQPAFEFVNNPFRNVTNALPDADSWVPRMVDNQRCISQPIKYCPIKEEQYLRRIPIYADDEDEDSDT